MRLPLRTVPLILIIFLLCSCNNLGSAESATPTAGILADSFFFGCAYLDTNGSGEVEADDPGVEGATFTVNLSWGGGSAADTRADGCATVVIPGGLGEESWPVTVHMEPPPETGYELVGPAEVVLVRPESHADFLFTVSLESNPAGLLTTTAASEDASLEPATSTPTAEAEGSAEDVVVSLVEAKVRERGGYDQSVRVEVEKETLPVSLPGLSFYRATPMVVDILDDYCAVYGEEVWCSHEALQNIVRQFTLGANPERLSDEEWLALITFFIHTVPVNGPDDLKLIDGYIPGSEQTKISPPTVSQPASGGVEISFYYESVSYDAYPDGPMALRKLEVLVTKENTITVQHQDVWTSPEQDE